MLAESIVDMRFLDIRQKHVVGEELNPIKGWKSALLMQFQPQFQATILAGILVGFIVSMVNFIYAISNDRIPESDLRYYLSSALYIFDGFYFIELLLMIIYKGVAWKEIKCIYPPRGGYIVILELLSLIPLEIGMRRDLVAYYSMRLRYSVRMIRMVLYVWQKEKTCEVSSTVVVMINLQMAYFLVSVIASFIIVPMLSIYYRKYITDHGFLTFLYAITSKITAKGFGMAFGETKLFDYSLCILTIMAFMMASYYTSRVACSLIPWIRYKFSYAHNYMRIGDYIRRWCSKSIMRKSNLYPSYEKTFVSHFQISLENANFFMYKEMPKGQIPDTILREISLDICWSAFKHSHLFSDQSICFLRRLSEEMEYRFFLPGEPIYKKQFRKACMVYVVSGIVQIISEENSETPILSLSGGSCFGETSLLMEYPATYTLISKTSSEIVLLHRKKFVKLYKIFPKTCKKLALDVNKRYEQAKDYQKVRLYQQKLYHKQTGIIEDPSIIYIYVTLKRLLYNEEVYGKEGRLNKTIIDSFCFCADYLDLLSITEDLELVTDNVLIKRKFPYIFQPDSMILKCWDLLVGTISLILVFAYPLLVCTTTEATQLFFYNYYICLLTFLWSGDIYLRISTAVKTREAFLTDVSAIIYYRLSTLSFLVDLWCVFPLGVVISLLQPGLSMRVMLLLEINKLLKVYRMQFFIARLGHLNSKALLFNKYVKVTVYSFLLIYYSACTFYLMLCKDECNAIYLTKIKTYYEIEKDDKLLIFIQLYAIASYFINDVEVFEMFTLLEAKYVITTVIMQIFYACVYIYLLADAIATDTVNQMEKHEFKEFASDMDIIMKKFRFRPELQKRVSTFLMDQYSLNMGRTFLNPKINQEVLSKNLFILHQFIMYATHISNIPLFENLDDKTISEVCKKVNAVMYARNHIIMNAGEICKEMHFIMHGQCKRVDRMGCVSILKANDYFGVFEMCAGILNMHTIVTTTDCKILSITVQDYQNILRKYQNLNVEVNEALEFCKTDRNFYVCIEGNLANQIESVFTRNMQARSFHVFKKYKKRSDNLSFFMGFSGAMVICKLLLMRITIAPYGKFLFTYEAIRIIFILSTNFLCSSVIIVDSHNFFYTLLTLDILSWIDIYIMHHVSFFNNAGLEIYHPMYTAKHYWTHSLFVDVLGCLPIDYFFAVKTYIGCCLRLNRCIQIRRILAFFNYVNTNNISRTGIEDILKYFPLCALIINYIALLFLAANCNLHMTTQRNDECACRYLVKRKMSNVTFTATNMQASGLLFISSTLAMIGITRFYLKNSHEMAFLSVLVLFAVVFSIWLTAKMVANNFYRNSDLTTYQQAIKEMAMFFSYRKVDKNIKKEIIDHYEHVWQKKRCKDLHHMMSYFNTCFKEDLLFDIFGDALKASEIFPDADKSFYKSLLLEMKHVVLLKRAIIYKVNDVHDQIFFLVNGEVEVLGADYKKLVVLRRGSLFGSLDDYPFMRQTLMMIARSNLELLCVPSQRFHYILSQYRKLHTRYLHLTNIHNDYLVCDRYIDSEAQVSHVVYKKARYSSRLTRLYCRINPVYKKITLMRTFELSVLMLTGFFGFHLEVIQKVVWNHSSWLTSFLYFLDFLHLVKIYAKLHTAYINKLGMTVTSREKIAKHYWKSSKLDVYVDVLSLIPLEVISLAISDQETYEVVSSFCRLNRTLRVISVCNAFKNALEKLNINVVIMRILFICILLSIYIHVLTGVLIYIRFTLRVHTPDYYDRLTLYETTMLVVLYTTMGNSINNFTVTFTLPIVICCVLLTIMGRFIITLFIAESCAIMESVNKNKNTYKVLSTHINKFVSTKYVSVPLQKEVKRYLRMMWIYHRGVHFPQLLENAPYYLREATLNAMFGCHLRQHPVLGNFHVDLIRQMAAEMRLIILFPGNNVVNMGDVDGCMYFIHQGVIDALSADSLDTEVIENTLVAGDSFGLIQGIHPRYGHDYTYKVREHAILVALKRKSWFYKLCMFPASQEILSGYLNSQSGLEDFN